MTVFFCVNSLEEVTPQQTTTRMLEATLGLEREVVVFDVLSFSIGPNEISASGVKLLGPMKKKSICSALVSRPKKPHSVLRNSTIVIRTSPGRDTARSWAHRSVLESLLLASERGVNILNRPAGLQKASSKLYSVRLPHRLTPKSIVTTSVERAIEFVESLGGRAVVKPLLGSQGRDVFLVSLKDPNVKQIFSVLGRSGYFIVQEFLEEARLGDQRILVLDGDILQTQGRFAGVHRIPNDGGFRANVSLGARVVPATFNRGLKENVREIAKVLFDDGIRFAGLDFVGNKLIEANVFSTGGLGDAETFADVDFASPLMCQLLVA